MGMTVQRHVPPPKRSVEAPPMPMELSEVWKAIQALPEAHRHALVLRY
jgi:hypothetical protein